MEFDELKSGSFCVGPSHHVSFREVARSAKSFGSFMLSETFTLPERPRKGSKTASERARAHEHGTFGGDQWRELVEPEEEVKASSSFSPRAHGAGLREDWRSPRTTLEPLEPTEEGTFTSSRMSDDSPRKPEEMAAGLANPLIQLGGTDADGKPQSRVTPGLSRRSSECSASAALSAFMQLLLLIGFVCLDVGKSIMNGFALRDTGIVTQSMVVAEGVIQVSVSLGLSYARDGKEGVAAVLSPATILQYGVVALLFSLSGTFNVLSYTILAPGTVKLLGQTRLLDTAVLSVLVLGRRYIQTQWMMLLMIVLFTMNFFLAQLDAQEMINQIQIADTYMAGHRNCYGNLTSCLSTGTRTMSGVKSIPPSCCVTSEVESKVVQNESVMIMGMCFVLLYLFLTDFGCVLSEKFYKDGWKAPFYQQKATVEVAMLPISLLMSFMVPLCQEFLGAPRSVWEPQRWWDKDGSFFLNWSWVVVGALMVTSVHSFFAGLVVKKLSSVMKNLGKCLSLTIVYFVGDCWLLPVIRGINDKSGTPAHCGSPVCSISAIMVLLGTLTFLGVEGPPQENPSIMTRESEQSSFKRAPSVEMVTACSFNESRDRNSIRDQLGVHEKTSEESR